MKRFRPAVAGIILAFVGITVPAALLAPSASASACTISEDASTPAVVHSTYGQTAVTSASFSPPAGSTLEVVADALHAADTITLTDSNGGTYTAGPHIQGTTQKGSIYFFQRYLATTPGAMTVTAHVSGSTVATTSLAVRVVDNAATTQTGAASATKTGTGTTQYGSLTTTTAGSWAYADMGNGDATETVTPLSTTANTDVWKDTTLSGNLAAIGRSAAATGTPGATNFGWTGSGSNNYVWAAQEVLPAQTCGTGQAPVVITNAATGVTPSAATMNGSVNPEGQATTYQFDFGTTTGYGTSLPSPAGSAGSGTTAVNESYALTGLAASTTYHYRIEATNATGTSYGADQTFTTSAVQAPPAVTTTAASGVTSSAATVNGTVNPNGAATTCHFDWGLTTAYGNATADDTSPGSGNAAVPVSASLTGLTASTAYHDRLVCSNSGGTTNGADSSFTTSAATTDLLNSKLGLYNAMIGGWEGPSSPPFSNATVIANTVAAKPQAVQYELEDCWSDQTCGRDGHVGSLSRANFDTEIQKITGSTGYNAALWMKSLPIAYQGPDLVDGQQFCPAPSNWAMNLNLFKSQLDEIKAAIGTSIPVVWENSNEAEYDCWRYWATFDPGITGAGSVGVSRNIGDMYAAVMPALVKYARTLGFAQFIPVGYIGIEGGPGWGQACTQDGTGQWGWSCAYQSRWATEFNTEVHNAYVANGNDPDYLPPVESVHAYPHGNDFSSTAGYDFPDGEAYQYYRNWLIQTRAVVNSIWGTTNGNTIRFAVSEWNAGYSRSTGNWVGWTTAGMPGAFYDGWYNMLQGDGNTQGAGTRWWSADLFGIASNSDTGTGRYYNVIKQDGTPQDWYANWKTASLNDPNR